MQLLPLVVAIALVFGVMVQFLEELLLLGLLLLNIGGTLLGVMFLRIIEEIGEFAERVCGRRSGGFDIIF